MTEAERLNTILETQAPAIAACLSPLGRRAAFPKGIPFQAAAAKGTEINATIGQMTDGAGNPLPLPSLSRLATGLDPKKTFLYGPVQGHPDVCDAWGARERRIAGDSVPETSRPVATHGLTHGLSILANLFADDRTEIIVPDLHWGNYRLVFPLHSGAKVRMYPFYSDHGFNVKGLQDALAATQGKPLVILNFPGNPTGYMPSSSEVQGIIEALQSLDRPAVVIVDDAYEGFAYDTRCHQRSVFWDILSETDPAKLAVFKVDGATKELMFFPSRVGFITHGWTGAVETALLSKIKYVIRGTVGCPPGPSMAMVQTALSSAELESEFAEARAVMESRYRALKHALDQVPAELFAPLPFNSAYFLLLKLPDTVDAEAVRVRLIEQYSVGTICFAAHNALRIAYCSVPEHQLAALIERIQQAVRDELR